MESNYRDLHIMNSYQRLLNNFMSRLQLRLCQDEYQICLQLYEVIEIITCNPIDHTVQRIVNDIFEEIPIIEETTIVGNEAEGVLE
ncbi:unnamed protein product [Chironomus riparius]|uniref:Uncharacterized protein n=1 Tax=Chironomus riparius TaxID=315576 RepID=A0A9N9RKM4_9DIPT|nr:unnamed protein product [Chironomus riparius]